MGGISFVTRQKKRWGILGLAFFCALALAGCGGGGSDEEKGDVNWTPTYCGAAFHSDQAEGNGEVKMDLSATGEGYVGLLAESDARLKLQVIKDGEEYLYDIRDGREEIFPLQCGNGTYTFKVMKNAGENKYYEIYSCDADVTLESDNAPFLRPNQYADYREDSNCVKLAGEMAAASDSEEDFVKKVYEYIAEEVSYDEDKARTIEKGYIPDPDATMVSGKGICFDYASLAASMLRSQGIPTKIIFGYVAPDNLYHAWNMFYTKEKGWSSVEFSVNPNEWNRLDLTFYSNGENDEFIGDGSNYTEVYQY